MNHKLFLGELKTLISSYDSKARVILFGSRARGDFKTDSDWDLLILTTEKVTAGYRNNLIDLIFDLELKYSQQVSTLISTQKNWEEWEILPLYKNIAREGVLI
ncbi:MAG TPA: nucleotidyltransferase domain-containing protein [Flavisolibacter sp.]|jgi:predicted nucleotidyltransferase|nr:nucleotidyltransferase domain-containing protein [Flavisolibacter sp.]